MLLRNNQATPSLKTGFQGYMRQDVIFSAGMHPQLEFKYSGVAPEPIQTWDDANRKYTDPVIGYKYSVVQDVVGDDSTSYQQNPVMVRVDGAPVNLSFGDTIKFENLLGYRNKSYKYSFQASAIKKVK
ncbi:hypothetical protein [Levilactobacillus cerevisiae]|uniref:hypothetical protein n=1 Tax=Levilactobacillus cerevisiae TaxID=1704076 RepID=UPI000F786364|nr:hypothetical protein [Levilactobacillus cerevisiae]